MIKLYDEDSYIKSFSGKVEKCVPHKDGYLILLDKTAFFPTAGGQECDRGQLDGQPVLAAIEEDDGVYHLVKNPIEVGKTVTGELNWEERFRKMQHHTAEHIVSGIAFSRFGLNNAGFHLDENGVTADYDAEISGKQLAELELCANEAVWKNLAVSAFYPSEKELKSINYRSKSEISGKIRIVTIDGIDVCACCAPHVKRTGEIGIIKFTEAVRHRGGLRIKIICAGDALLDYSEKQNSVFEISKMLSAPQNEVAEAVSKLKSELDSAKKEKNEAVKKLASAQALSIPETSGNYYVFSDISDKNALRILANEGKKRVGGIFLVLSGDDNNGYSYIAVADNDISGFVKSLNAALSGKGGGKGGMAEGHISATREQVNQFGDGAVFVS